MYLARRTASRNFKEQPCYSSLELLCLLAKYADYKTSWPPEPIGHKSWKANRGSSQSQLSRPPPGLPSQKQPSPSPWSGGGPRLAGRGWGSGSSTSGNPYIHPYIHSCRFPYYCVLFIEAPYLFHCSIIETMIPEGRNNSRPSELAGSNGYTNLDSLRFYFRLILE